MIDDLTPDMRMSGFAGELEDVHVVREHNILVETYCYS